MCHDAAIWIKCNGGDHYIFYRTYQKDTCAEAGHRNLARGRCSVGIVILKEYTPSPPGYMCQKCMETETEGRVNGNADEKGGNAPVIEQK